MKFRFDELICPYCERLSFYVFKMLIYSQLYMPLIFWSINSIFLISITIIHFSNSNYRAVLTSLGRSLTSAELHGVGFVLGACGRIAAAGIFVWAWLASRPGCGFLYFSLLFFPFFLFFLLFCFGSFYFLVYFMNHHSVSSFAFVNDVTTKTFKVGNFILYHFNGLFIITWDVTRITAGWAALRGVTGFRFH